VKRLLLVLAACGGGSHANPSIDAPPDVSTVVPDVTPGCMTIAEPAGQYMTAADFGPFVPGTLAGWDPDGRWFLTGTQVGSVSSFHFARTGSQIVVDRDPTSPGTIDDDAIVQRHSVQSQGVNYTIAIRVTNRAGDGSLRADRAVCDGGSCRVCTAKLIRATHFNNEGEGQGLTLLGQLNDPTWGAGYTFNVRVDGTIAYLIREDGLHIIETADPAHPTELGIYRRPQQGYSNDVKVIDVGAKRYALTADYGVDIVDVTDPAHPALAATISEDAHTIAIESRGGKLYAYLGNYDATCPIYDITDPLHPAKLGAFHTTGQLVHDLSVDQGIAYLNAWDAGFQVVDFTNPAAPALLGKWAPTPTRTSHSNWTTTVGTRHIALHGEEAYGAHLHIIDLATMQPIAEWKTRDYVSIHNIMVFGSKAYFTHYQDGVRVLDVSDPTAPQQIGYYNTWDPQADYTSSDFFEGAVGFDVDVTRHLVFVADSPRGLLILSDATP
jgi:hypothetical protein